MQGIAQQEERSPMEDLGELVSDFLSGQRINVADVVNIFTQAFPLGGHMASGYAPPMGGHAIPPDGNGVRYGQAQQQRWSQPDPPPPIDHEAELEKQKARATLGFMPQEPLNAEIIRKRHRELMKRHHPDRGGSVARMAAINAARDTLLGE